MQNFRFTAVSATGELHRGVMEAGDADQVVRKLQREGFIPIKAEPASHLGTLSDLLDTEFGGMRRGLSRDQMATVTRELATMLAAGESMDRALRFVCETAANHR